MKFLSYGVMVYMLMALIWWTILLTRNNQTIYQKNQLLLTTVGTGESENHAGAVMSEQQISKEFIKNKYMILGEGMVFGISLILGMWFIQKAYTREMENNIKQKNFLLSVTHELKSPITSVNLITQTLLKRTLMPEQQKDLHESILKESTRLEKLIDNLLLTTKIENSYQYNYEKTDITLIIEEVLKVIKLQYPEVAITFSHSLPTTIHADKEAIYSVISNLVENGIKYSDSPASIMLGLKTDKNQCIIDIADHGRGIPDSEKEKVRGLFYRTGNEEIRQTKGTGLGLYIVDKIVEAHRGRLKISDNHPRGTVVTVTLPL